LTDEKLEDFIQTDAPINLGNSGGALVDTLGRLVGINTAIYSRSGGNVGIGFAVPTRIAIPIIEQLKIYGEVRRGRLGVETRDLTPEVAGAMGIGETRGALVTQVEEGTPGASAGLKAGDVVVRVNGTSTHNARDLRNTIGLSPVDAELTLVVLRDGKEVTLKARLTPPQVAAGRLHLLGAIFGPLPEDNPLARHVRGVLVTRVEPDSPAARNGLRTGDIVVQLNRKDTPSPDALQKQLASLGKVAALTVVRGNSERIIVIEKAS
jgi:serine protease DegQ